MAMMASLKPVKGEYQRYASKKDQSLRIVKTRKLKRKRRVPRTVPRAPFNDSSFLMRVRRAGGVESSTYRDFLDHEDYGYGSMDGFLRLRDNRTTSAGAQNLEQRVDRFEVMDLKAKQPQQQQASRVWYLEDENLALKERLVLVQLQVDELRDRLRGNDNSPQSCLES